ncbi:polysaccharide deacetylase family protein [Roseococcus pinisoli]|uniref:Chitooligosaccharide deacetylase n=1 Tax=Roseococcus pinisoli TaxID=2835040 RepID=A0ABS5QB26_9PROT|nr:polysaccharide deacetylase family protein [Roseococcus pinisoli]MBS7810865.1 polysaccharide deacetylase family protein [Roseococcus pinisoli]
MRDFEGYGRNPPDPRWPNGAKLALNFVINHEEGGEESVPDGDPRTENALTEGSTAPVKGRDLGAESMFQYGSRVGFWRLHRLFTERGLPCTVFAVARSLERTPQAVAAIREAGWDVCAHGWKWEMHIGMEEAQERQRIADATALIAKLIGKPPLGWYTRYAPSLNTRRLLAEAGYLYDSDAYDDELPYWTDLAGQPRLVLPYNLAHNDIRFQRAALTAGEEFFQYIKGAVELMLAEPGGRMLSVGLHNRIIGHPGRAAGLAKLLDWLKTQPQVWVCRREEIARHWIAHHQP